MALLNKDSPPKVPPAPSLGSPKLGLTLLVQTAATGQTLPKRRPVVFGDSAFYTRHTGTRAAPIAFTTELEPRTFTRGPLALAQKKAFRVLTDREMAA